jgi:hypothetical protein
MTAPAEREVKSNRAWREECETLRERNDMSKEAMKQALGALVRITEVPTGAESMEDWCDCFDAISALQDAIRDAKEESPRNYFLPGEYIGDMGNGDRRLTERIRSRVGEVEVRRVQFELHSYGQQESMVRFLDATRKLNNPGDTYMDKLVIALDENTGCYMYDGQYFGFVTF